MTHRQPQLNRRHALALGAGLALSAATMPAWAQSSWPSRSIRLMVNFPAGGSSDAIARPIAAVLAESLGQPVVVVNRGGGIGQPRRFRGCSFCGRWLHDAVQPGQHHELQPLPL